MFNTKYKDLRLIPSKSAGRELSKYGITIEDCKEILENGYEPKKRKKNIIEKWMDSGKKIYNVVVVKSYSYMHQEEIYLIIHVGRFTKKKIKHKED